jgi:hypothetical protein
MAEIKSHNNEAQSPVKKLLVPDFLQLTTYAMVSILLLAIMRLGEIWGWFSKSVSKPNTSDQFASNPTMLHNVWESVSQGRTPQVIFWIIVGISVYGFVWFLWNISNNVRNDLIAGDYVHPRNYDTKKYWQSLIARKIFFVLAVMIFIFYLVVYIKLFALMAALCQNTISDFEVEKSLSILISCPLVGAVLTHILVVIARIAMNSWRTIYIDL